MLTPEQLFELTNDSYASEVAPWEPADAAGASADRFSSYARLVRLFTMFCCHRCAETAARGKISVYLHPARLCDQHEVIQNQIRDMFVECPVVAILLQVKFQRFEFKTDVVRNISDRQRAEIGLSCDGTDRREFRSDSFNHIVPFGVRILEGLQQVGRWFRHHACSGFTFFTLKLRSRDCNWLSGSSDRLSGLA